MANYKKSFSFRHGVQVDNDNFIVNTNGLVGIGTTVPTYLLDVRGNVGVTGLTTITTLSVSGVSTFSDNVKIGTGITFEESTNTIIAPNIKIGTSPTISNVVGYSTVGWIVNETAYGISTSLNVGIHTDAPSDYLLTVGGNPSIAGETGIGVTGGHIRATGIITASSFDGTVDVNDLSGIIGNDHIPDTVTSNINITTGISTFNNVNIGAALTVSGALTGTASTAQGLTGTPDIVVGITTVSRLKANYIGIGTENPLCDIQVGTVTGIATGYGGYSEDNSVSVIKAGSIGIGTTNPSEEFEICNNSNATINVKSGATSDAIVSLGSNTLKKAELGYDSSTDILSLKNYSGRDIQFDVTTTNSGTGGVVLKKDNTKIFSITNEGKVAINKNSDPVDNHSLEVNGSALIGGATSITGTLTVDSDGVPFTLTGGNQTFPIDPNQNLNSNSGITTLRELHIIDSGGFKGINISGSGIGKTVAIGTDATFFEDDFFTVGTASTFKGNVFIDEDLTINKDVRIGTGSTYTDENDGTELKLIVNQCAEFNEKVSFGTTVTGITTTPKSVGIGTQGDPVVIENGQIVSTGQTASLSFDVPPWAISSRVNFTNLTTGLGQPGFRIRVNGQSTNYDGATMIHFPYAANQPYYSERIEWGDTATAGCFVGVSSYLMHNNEFGRMMYASGYINLSMLDPALHSTTTTIEPQLMVDGVVNLVSSLGIQTHMAQAVLSGVITLDRGLPLGAGYTFSSVSIAATGVTGTENNFLHVGVSTTNIASAAYGQGIRKGRVNVTHFR
jgi:hypothetical protein